MPQTGCNKTEVIALRAVRIISKGGCHIGGRKVRIEGSAPIKTSFWPGGPPVVYDPNGDFQAGQMYVQYTCSPRLQTPNNTTPSLSKPFHYDVTYICGYCFSISHYDTIIHNTPFYQTILTNYSLLRQRHAIAFFFGVLQRNGKEGHTL